MRPWNGWYHCMGHTYGAWLRGDERGWRARHHREHVDGDYKRPPPAGAHGAQLRRSQALLERPEVALTPAQREAACAAMGEKLMAVGVELVELCVARQHFHLLARFSSWQRPGMAIPGLCQANALRDGRDPAPRHVVGMAKKHAAFVLRDYGIVGGVWATRSKAEPIRSRAHQVQVVEYIRAHAAEGAAVWSVVRRAKGDGSR